VSQLSQLLQKLIKSNILFYGGYQQVTRWVVKSYLGSLVLDRYPWHV